MEEEEKSKEERWERKGGKKWRSEKVREKGAVEEDLERNRKSKETERDNDEKRHEIIFKSNFLSLPPFLLSFFNNIVLFEPRDQMLYVNRCP